jgi:PKD repeat protein
LVGGAAAILLSANHELTPYQVRKALMETASNAETPDNNYGWGIIDILAAYNWGANFTVDVTVGSTPLTVNFTDSSISSASSWKYYFGDGDSAMTANPTHIYVDSGLYTVRLEIESAEGSLSRTKERLIHAITWSNMRGDADNSGGYSIEDITFLIKYKYKDGPAPVIFEAGDANADLSINIKDITYLIKHIYKDGPSPPPLM